ncbi:MAG: TlpA disulfide reductase family protein [Mariprofundaceae bacterium]
MLKNVAAIIFLMLFSLPAQAVDFKWVDTQGDVHEFANEYQGQPVILHFWASWCPPCVAEMPEMSTWLKLHPEVKILPVSLDQNIETVQAFLKENRLELPALLTDQNQAAKMGIRGLPTSILMAADGSIISSRIGSQNWQHGNWSQQLLTLFQPQPEISLQE